MKVTRYNTSFDVIETKNVNFWSKNYPIWESKTFDFLLSKFNKDKTFVDIGSWIGPISMVASEFSYQCICFEPDEIAYEEFISNIKLNNIKNIVVENMAVSPYSEIVLGANELGTSVTREDCFHNSKTYKCITIENIFKKYNLSENNVSVIKIDVEGHESELLKEKFLWDLNIPMQISLHPAYKPNKQKYYEDILPFFNHKNINMDLNKVGYYDIQIN